MNRTDSKTENSALETREPVTAYYGGGGGSAVADAFEADFGGEFTAYGGWHDDEDDEPVTLERAAAIRKDPGFIAWMEDFYRSFEEGIADARAGRMRPLDEAVDEILRDIENGTI